MDDGGYRSAFDWRNIQGDRKTNPSGHPHHYLLPRQDCEEPALRTIRHQRRPVRSGPPSVHVLRRQIRGRGSHKGPHHAEVPGRNRPLAEHRSGVQALQPLQGQPPAARVRNGADRCAVRSQRSGTSRVVQQRSDTRRPVGFSRETVRRAQQVPSRTVADGAPARHASRHAA